MIAIAINGFGRIGRNLLRILMSDAQARNKLRVVAINLGPAKREAAAHMFKYDTLMGTYQGSVSYEGNDLVVDGQRIRLITEKDPQKINWKQFDIQWVVDCSGHFTKREGAQQHLAAGAEHVLISAPAHGEDVTIIPGVNDALLDKSKHRIVSLGSCTTNALLPMLKVLHDTFGIQYACMTTVHAYTNTQVLLDVETDDLRRSRAAALNIIPTGSGAKDMVGKVIPALAGRVEVTSLRVPVAKVSIVDLTVMLEKPLQNADVLNKAFIEAAQGSLQGILGLTMEPLVSSDFSGDARSVIIDGQLTAVSGPHLGKIFGWYDNEWGYSARLKDFLVRYA